MGLVEDLGSGPIGLDSAIFIYFIEEHRSRFPLVLPVFEAIDEGRFEAATSSLTLLETLVVPLRAGNLALAARYEALLTRSRGVRMVEIDLPVLRSAAQIRAATGLKTPDSLQLACALAAGCSAFLTNDRDYPPLGNLRVLRLDRYLPAN